MKTRLFIVFVLGSGLAFVSMWAVAAQGGWLQSNTSGFGVVSNETVFALTPFGGQLYAGTSNGGGAQLWRLGSGGWTSVVTDGFGNGNNLAIDHLTVFSDTLYAGTVNDTDGGEVWRSSDGSSWSRVVSAGFGDPTNTEVMRFAVFSDTLYASTWSSTDTHGAEIWRSGTGDSGNWTRVVSNGFNGDANNGAIVSFEVFSDTLCAGTLNETSGGEVWCSSDGTDWTQANSDGFGSADNRTISSLAAFNGYLYAGVYNSTTGAQIWRSPDGTSWTQVEGGGFGNVDTRGMNALEVFDDQLYFAVGNYTDGMEVWRSSTGNSGDWEQVGFAGFGDSNNWAPYWDNSVTVFSNSLYVGTWNSTDGGEVWQYLHNKVYLPLVLRNYPPALPPLPPILDPISNPDGDGNYNVGWSAPSDATSYLLEEDDNGSFSSPTTVYSGPATSTSISGKSDGTYYYRVNASNAHGTSPWSNTESVVVSTGGGWTTILTEDFEGPFPGPWDVWDENGASYGEYYWGKRDCMPYAGSYSGWAVGDGSSGSGLSCGASYPNYVQSLMRYGPFSLADASAAELTFKLWQYSESSYDFFFWGAATDGMDFWGWTYSGDSLGWSDQVLDLADVYKLGDLTGEPAVWIVLAFVSDGSITYAEGAHVDDIVLRKYVGTMTGSPGETAPTDPVGVRKEPARFSLEP
jgi:hypothetical protein